MTPDAGGPAIEEVGKYMTVYQRDAATGLTPEICGRDQQPMPHCAGGVRHARRFSAKTLIVSRR